jgi:DNA (cytosine-5)-methyltransferase 1
MKIPIISLFCGCGGFDLGFIRPGFEVLLALDIDHIAVSTYNYNRGKAVAQVADLSKLSAEDIHMRLQQYCPGITPRGVIAGPPCQFFSESNVHLKSKDIRRLLPQYYARILKDLNGYYNLDFFVFENVRGIKSTKHHQDYVEIKELFREAGFTLFEGVLDPINYGVAQKRPRVFIVGLNNHKYLTNEFSFPPISNLTPIDVFHAIGNLPDPVLFKRGLPKEAIQFHPNHWTMCPKSIKFRNGTLKEGMAKGRSFRVLSWNKPSWTVAYGNREIHIHPSGKRRLSVFEAMLLQGFPESYELLGTLSQQIRQISDAIPPQLGEALAKSLWPIISNGENFSV